MPRYCFLLQVRPERIAEYRRRHREVWPEIEGRPPDEGFLLLEEVFHLEDQLAALPPTAQE
jgi:hypothetical protein